MMSAHNDALQEQYRVANGALSFGVQMSFYGDFDAQLCVRSVWIALVSMTRAVQHFAHALTRAERTASAGQNTRLEETR